MSERTRLQLEEMVEFISQKLHSTSQFRVIEPNYSFRNDALDNQRKRHIYLENNDNKRLLVVCNSDYYNGTDYRRKLIEASRNDIYSCFVLYKGRVHEGLKENQDFYFRRETAHGHARYSTRHLGNVAGNAIIWMTGLEKDMLHMYPGQKGNRNMVYYQPLTERRPQSMRVFHAKDVPLNYDRSSNSLAVNKDSDAMIQVVPHPRLDLMENFTFLPYMNLAPAVGRKIVEVPVELKMAIPYLYPIPAEAVTPSSTPSS